MVIHLCSYKRGFSSTERADLSTARDGCQPPSLGDKDTQLPSPPVQAELTLLPGCAVRLDKNPSFHIPQFSKIGFRFKSTPK